MWARAVAASAAAAARGAAVRARPAAAAALQAAGYKTNINGVRPGNVLEINGRLLVVLKATTVKNAQRRAQVTLELRDLQTGNKANERFRAGDDVEQVDLIAVKGQFLYRTDNKVTVMNGDTFETFELDVDVVEGGADAANLLTEGVEVTLQVYNEDKVVSLRPPETVTCTVTETVPSFKGQQASASSKPAKVDTGATIHVPPYVEIGDKIVVNVQEQRFVSRKQ